MYGFMIAILLYTPLNGFLWYNNGVAAIVLALFVILMCCGLGFVFYGLNIFLFCIVVNYIITRWENGYYFQERKISK
jgi:hypothetical protein